MQVNFELEIDDEVKHIEKGKVGRIDTCAFDKHGVIYYVEFPEKHVPNHWFRPEILRKVD